MADHLILLAPSANRVYASEADRLVAAELKIMLGADDHPPIEPVRIAGIGYLALATECLDEHACAALGRLSGCYATFHREHDRLLPIEIIRPDLFDDDLVTIPKYPGKTNEQFTRLLINVTLASMRRPSSGPISILDPLCGRGTVLSTCHDARVQRGGRRGGGQGSRGVRGVPTQLLATQAAQTQPRGQSGAARRQDHWQTTGSGGDPERQGTSHRPDRLLRGHAAIRGAVWKAQVRGSGNRCSVRGDSWQPDRRQSCRRNGTAPPLG